MQPRNLAPLGYPRPFTLRRQGKSALKFNGDRIGSATRINPRNVDDEQQILVETTARLFKTVGNKYVLGIEEYDKTNGDYLFRWAESASSVEEFSAKVKAPEVAAHVDDDLLGEVFGNTDIVDQYTEYVD